MNDENHVIQQFLKCQENSPLEKTSHDIVKLTKSYDDKRVAIQQSDEMTIAKTKRFLYVTTNEASFLIWILSQNEHVIIVISNYITRMHHSKGDENFTFTTSKSIGIRDNQCLVYLVIFIVYLNKIQNSGIHKRLVYANRSPFSIYYIFHCRRQYRKLNHCLRRKSSTYLSLETIYEMYGKYIFDEDCESSISYVLKDFNVIDCGKKGAKYAKNKIQFEKNCIHDVVCDVKENCYSTAYRLLQTSSLKHIGLHLLEQAFILNDSTLALMTLSSVSPGGVSYLVSRCKSNETITLIQSIC